MKQFILFLCLLTATIGLNSCSKNNDPTPDPVVGSWKLDRIRFAGYPSPYASYNGDDDPTQYGLQDVFTIKTDKTFSGTQRSAITGKVTDYNGNWDYTNNTLTLKNNIGNSVNYTLDATQTPQQLLGQVVTYNDTLTNSTTKVTQIVKASYQFIYARQ